MNFLKLLGFILLFWSNRVYSQTVNLSQFSFYIQAGFKEEWVKQSPEDCNQCKIVDFKDDLIPSIRVRKIFPEKFYEANESFSWEEKVAGTFTIGTKFRFDSLPDPRISYGIFLERIGINWEVYLNGVLLHSEMHLDSLGRVNLHKEVRFPIIPIPKQLLQKGENTLYFRIAGDIRDYHLGIFFNGPEIDRIENLMVRQFDVFRFCVQISYFVISIFYFVFYLLNRDQKFNLFFAIGLLTFGTYRFLDSHLAFYWLEDSSIQQNLMSIAYVLLSGVMMFYINYLIEDKAHWVTKVNFLLFFPLCALKLALPPAYTFPFLLNVAGNIAMISFPYLVFYRINFKGFLFFGKKYIETRELKRNFAFISSIKESWKSSPEFGLAVFISLTYSSFIIDYVLFSKYDAHFYTSDFSFLVFYGLMSFITYRRKYELTQKHKREIERLQWEKEKEKLQSELAMIRERETVFADIHDNLGGKLLDLSFQLKQIQVQESSKKMISESIDSVLKGLRNRLLEFEDMKAIETDFQEGIKLFLIRRYSKANRRIQFHEADSMVNSRLIFNTLPTLLNVLSELVNNDLKYGYGDTEWTLSHNQKNLEIEIRANSSWEVLKKTKGNGSRTLSKGANALGGTIEETLTSESYQAKITVPIKT